jgi:hypothetical protein
MTPELVFKQQTSNPCVEDMWLFIDELLPRYGDIVDRSTMNYDQVFKLFYITKESYHLFQILVQTAVLKKSIDKLQLLKTQSSRK